MPPVPLRNAVSTAVSAIVAAMPTPAMIRAASACRGPRAKTTIAAATSGAGINASWSPLPSIVLLPPGTGQRRRSDLCGAVRADPPAEAKAAIAPGAPPGKLGPAVGAENELLLDLASAGGAGPSRDAFGRWLEQHLLLDGKRPHLLHGQRGTDHEVDQCPEERGHEAEEHREERESGRRGAPARIANDIEGQREPEHREVGDDDDQHEGQKRPNVNQQHRGVLLWGPCAIDPVAPRL